MARSYRSICFRIDYLPAEGRDLKTNVFEWSIKGDEFVSESSFHTSGKRDEQKNSSEPIAEAEGVHLGAVGELSSFALEDRAEAYRRQVRECFEIGRQNGFNAICYVSCKKIGLVLGLTARYTRKVVSVLQRSWTLHCLMFHAMQSLRLPCALKSVSERKRWVTQIFTS